MTPAEIAANVSDCPCSVHRTKRDGLQRHIEEAIRAAVEAEQNRILALLAAEEAAYLANAKECDADGNTHGGTMDTHGTLVCRNIAAAIRARTA